MDSAHRGARFRRADGGRLLVFGHRGASARAPENTLAAFELALDEGADGVELDVRPCGSSELVVCHDADLVRVAGGDPGRVEALSLTDLRARELAGGARIPLLDEALDLVVGRGALVNIEIKSDRTGRSPVERAAAVAEVLARRAAVERERTLVSTFDPMIYEAFASMAPLDVARSFIFDSPLSRVVSTALGPDGYHPHHSLAERRFVERWRAAGAYVHTWTVDARDDIERADAAGVDAIITNDPRGAIAVRDRCSP